MCLLGTLPQNLQVVDGDLSAQDTRTSHGNSELLEAAATPKLIDEAEAQSESSCALERIHRLSLVGTTPTTMLSLAKVTLVEDCWLNSAALGPIQYLAVPAPAQNSISSGSKYHIKDAGRVTPL